MHDVSVASGIVEDTARVVLESVGDGDTAGNGSALVNFLKHVFLSLEVTVLVDAVDVVLVGDEAVKVWVAVLAHVDGRALDAVVVAACLVDRAGLVCDVVVAHELEGAQGETTVATVVVLGARDHYLG